LGDGSSSRADVHARVVRCGALAAWPRVSGGAAGPTLVRSRFACRHNQSSTKSSLAPRSWHEASGAPLVPCSVRSSTGPMFCPELHWSHVVVHVRSSTGPMSTGCQLLQCCLLGRWASSARETESTGVERVGRDLRARRSRFEHLGKARREHVEAWRRRGSTVLGALVALLPCWCLGEQVVLGAESCGVLVCPSGGWVMMFFSAASARAWGLVSGCVLVCVLTWLCVVL